MTIQVVRLTKKNKNFKRNNFRISTILLLASIALNCLLSFGIYRRLVNLQEPQYYATNGISAPQQLDPRISPNYTSDPLLASSQETDPQNKIVTYDQSN